MATIHPAKIGGEMAQMFGATKTYEFNGFDQDDLMN
jgi:hypothetical protein